jgi:hypothetical protein
MPDPVVRTITIDAKLRLYPGDRVRIDDPVMSYTLLVEWAEPIGRGTSVEQSSVPEVGYFDLREQAASPDSAAFSVDVPADPLADWPEKVEGGSDA